MKIFHSLCPLCHTISDGLCQKCLSLIKKERKSSYMKRVCPMCGKHLLHNESICSCDTAHYHHTLFDETIIIKSLIKGMKTYHDPSFISQIGEEIVDELDNICKLHPSFCYHKEDNTYLHFFDQLILYINNNLKRKSGTPLCICVKRVDARDSLSLIK